MMEIEVSYSEYMEICEKENVKSAGTIVAFLSKNYPDIFKKAIEELKEFAEIMEFEYRTIFDFVSWEGLVEAIDNKIDEDILINYYVKDYCVTDRGTQCYVSENGYVIVG